MTEQEQQNLLITVSVLPNLLIRLEDLVEIGAFRHEAKQNANRLIKAIEHFTNPILKGMEYEELDQLEQISKAFDEMANLE